MKRKMLAVSKVENLKGKIKTRKRREIPAIARKQSPQSARRRAPSRLRQVQAAADCGRFARSHAPGQAQSSKIERGKTSRMETGAVNRAVVSQALPRIQLGKADLAGDQNLFCYLEGRRQGRTKEIQTRRSPVLPKVSLGSGCALSECCAWGRSLIDLSNHSTASAVRVRSKKPLNPPRHNTSLTLYCSHRTAPVRLLSKSFVRRCIFRDCFIGVVKICYWTQIGLITLFKL